MDGARIFWFKDQGVGAYIAAGISATSNGGPASEAGYHSIVQDLAWPSPADEVPLEAPAHASQQPGVSWYQERLLAHTLLHRQMHQPAVKATLLQVSLHHVVGRQPVPIHVHNCLLT